MTRRRSRAVGTLSIRLSSRAWLSESIQWRSSKTSSRGWTWLSRSRRRLTASTVRWRRWGGIEALPLRVLDGDVEQGEEDG